MQELIINNQPGMQILAMLGIGAVLVAVGCLLLELLWDSLERFSRLGLVGKVVVLFFVVQLTMFGGAKHGTNDVDVVTSTNDVGIVDGGDTNGAGGIVLNAPQPMFNGAAFLGGCGPFGTTAPTVVDPDVVRGYRLASVSTNDEISYAMPSEGVVRGTWHLTGAYENFQRVGLESLGGLEGAPFKFPIGNRLCTSLWAYTWGKVRPQLRNISNEIVAVGAPMSAIPGVSRFWTMATTNDTYLMTWENFAVGRVGKAEVDSLQAVGRPLPPLENAQIELMRNGDFVTRSNEVESVWRRVIEPNPIGPGNPEDPDNPGMPVCPYGPAQDLSVIQETNAYCWVDIVVNNADAWVRFEGDGASNLLDPSFAAKVGETNHVVILIGKTYKVTCDMPFTVVAKSDPALDEWWSDDNTLWLNWPVRIEAWEGNGKSFMMHVVPNCLGGEFSWTNSCCSVSGSGIHFSYSCDGHCFCTGCSAKGYYAYEGYCIGCNGGWCGCSTVPGEWDGHDDPYDTDPAPSVSVWFEDEAVIFEDAYTNMPGEVVERKSTRTVLHLVVHGGMKGGTATFSFENRDKLVGFDIPTSLDVPAGHCKTYEFAYRGRSPSGATNDIVVTGTFTENDPEGVGDAATYTDEASMTSVRVALTPEDLPPMNPSPNRHIVGIHEKVNFVVAPASALVKWAFAQKELDDDDSYFNCPWTGGVYTVSAKYGGAQLDISISVVEPVVVCREARWDEELDAFAVVGESGWVGMRLSLYLLPRTVSFEWIEMEEIPVPSSQAILPTGYFYLQPGVLHPTHDVDMGAGKWSNPRLSDGSWTGDKARMPYACPPFVIDDPPEWAQGTMRWAIPVGCGELASDANGEVEHALRRVLDPNPTDQVYEMEADGTLTIRKYGHSIRRDVSGRVWLDGSRVNAWWN